MKRLIFAGLAVLVLSPVTLVAQDAGGLSQQVRRNMETAMNDLQNKTLLTTQESLGESVGKEKLDEFLSGAVVKLALHPDGSYDFYTLAGGELEAVRLGKQQLEPAVDDSREQAWARDEEEEAWTQWSGEFEHSRKPQALSLTLKAGGRAITVDCHNKYRKGDQTVTYYVGPLDGLFCMGLADSPAEEEAG